MDKIETLGILEEIQALVSDNLQVVSYKWLSRNFLVSSNAAKRLLQEFVEKHGSGLEVVYTLSGWLKSDPSIYHIKLVSGPKLADAKAEFDDNCSVQVYSVQACIPKDPATLWNAEFVQAEELFKQDPAVSNCLRDNRFCGVLNTFVKRNAEGTPATLVAPQPRSVGVSGAFKSNSTDRTVTIPLPQQGKVQKSSPKANLQTPNVVTDVKSGSYGGHEQVNKPSAEKEKVNQLPANKKKGQNDRISSGSGGSLANMWGRACAKSKTTLAEKNDSIPHSAVSAEAQICAREEAEGASSDDDDQDVNFKRASNGEVSRKRRVVFDFSDDEEEYKDAVNLASPDLPRKQSSLESEQSIKTSVPEKNNFNFGKKKEKPKDKEERVTDGKSNEPLGEDFSVVSKGKSTRISSTDKIQIHIPEKDVTMKDKVTDDKKVTDKESNKPVGEDFSVVSKGKNSRISSTDKTQSHVPENDATMKDKVTDATPNSPKRRKVLKTRIDDRGREVNEVVWEGEETDKKPDSNTMKADNHAVNNAVNRPPANKKTAAVGSTASSNPVGKAGNKKAGSVKDPKQGNILSFFKKV